MKYFPFGCYCLFLGVIAYFWVLLHIFAQKYVKSNINRLARTVLVDDVMMPNFTPGCSGPRTGGLLWTEFPSKAGGFLIRLLTSCCMGLGGRLTFVCSSQNPPQLFAAFSSSETKLLALEIIVLESFNSQSPVERV